MKNVGTTSKNISAKHHDSAQVPESKKSTKVFKIRLSKEAERQRDYYCSKISKIEWGGFALWKLEDDVIVVDKLIMLSYDNAGWTGYQYSEPRIQDKLVEVLMSYPEYQIGNVHSHHNMQAYFSETDKNDLYTNCKSFNMYLSLIVNNKKDMVAKVSQFVRETFTGNLKTQSNSLVGFTTEEEQVELYKEFALYYDCEFVQEEIFDKEAEQHYLEVKKEMDDKMKSFQQNKNFYTGEFGQMFIPVPKTSYTNNFFVTDLDNIVCSIVACAYPAFNGEFNDAMTVFEKEGIDNVLDKVNTSELDYIFDYVTLADFNQMIEEKKVEITPTVYKNLKKLKQKLHTL